MFEKRMQGLEAQLEALTGRDLDLSGIGKEGLEAKEMIALQEAKIAEQAAVIEKLIRGVQVLAGSVSAIQQALVRAGNMDMMPEALNTLEERDDLAALTAIAEADEDEAL